MGGRSMVAASPGAMWAAALHELGHGRSIVPITRGHKHPFMKWGHLHEERPSIADVALWLDEDPDANLAIVTGPVSDVVVIDADGPEALQALEQHGGMPSTWQVRTSRGVHFWFRHPGFMVTTTRGIDGVSDKLDVRGDRGGLALLPPSVHPSGATYEWMVDRDETPLADLPPWLAAKLRERTARRPDRGDPVDRSAALAPRPTWRGDSPRICDLPHKAQRLLRRRPGRDEFAAGHDKVRERLVTLHVVQAMARAGFGIDATLEALYGASGMPGSYVNRKARDDGSDWIAADIARMYVEELGRATTQAGIAAQAHVSRIAEAANHHRWGSCPSAARLLQACLDAAWRAGLTTFDLSDRRASEVARMSRTTVLRAYDTLHALGWATTETVATGRGDLRREVALPPLGSVWPEPPLQTVAVLVVSNRALLHPAFDVAGLDAVIWCLLDPNAARAVSDLSDLDGRSAEAIRRRLAQLATVGLASSGDDGWRQLGGQVALDALAERNGGIDRAHARWRRHKADRDARRDPA